jgi:hypothetical protein
LCFDCLSLFLARIPGSISSFRFLFRSICNQIKDFFLGHEYVLDDNLFHLFSQYQTEFLKISCH